MKLKITAIAVSVFVLLSSFAACSSRNGNEEETVPGIEPSKKSDADSVTIVQSYETLNDILAAMDNAFEASTPDEFRASLADSSVNTVKYSREKDIKIKGDEKIEKPFALYSGKGIDIDSQAKTAVIEKCGEIFELKKSIDTLIINGADVTAEIKAPCGAIYIEGKNAELHFYDADTKYIYADNATAVIVNHCDVPLTIMYINGAKASIPAGYTYSLNDDGLREGVFNA